VYASSPNLSITCFSVLLFPLWRVGLSLTARSVARRLSLPATPYPSHTARAAGYATQARCARPRLPGCGEAHITERDRPRSEHAPYHPVTLQDELEPLLALQSRLHVCYVVIACQCNRCTAVRHDMCALCSGHHCTHKNLTTRVPLPPSPSQSVISRSTQRPAFPRRAVRLC
jgi:hypothetical protein